MRKADLIFKLESRQQPISGIVPVLCERLYRYEKDRIVSPADSSMGSAARHDLRTIAENNSSDSSRHERDRRGNVAESYRNTAGEDNQELVSFDSLAVGAIPPPLLPPL